MTRMTRKKPEQLEVIRNPNYTISVIDGVGRAFIFSDICGSNLELLESILNPEATEKEEPISLDLEGIIAILNLLNTQEFDFICLPRRIIFKIFSVIKEHILCNYVSKTNWLKICYGIQNGSFCNVSAMESVPMSKFMAMYQIHKEAIAAMDKN